MNQLLRNLNKFINTIVEAYSLPRQLSQDLLTLNNYLKTYDPDQDSLLSNFVERVANRLEPKNKANIQEAQTYDMPFLQPISENISSIKYPDLRIDLKIDLPTQMSEADLSWNKSLLDRSERPLSYRSGKSKDSDGIKSARHKFGTRQRNKTQKIQGKDANKQNLHLNANIKAANRTHKQLRPQQRGLKIIKSQAELLQKNNNFTAFTRQTSTQTRREDPVKPKSRYESVQNKISTNNSTLRIKLRSKPILDLAKIQEGIHLLIEQMKGEEESIEALMQKITEEQEIKFQ